jgi:RHS repeat-associated protein
LTFTSFDEFGVAQSISGSDATSGAPARYGWLGAAQRSTEAIGGVILMGARLYSPSIGRFLQVDPVPGGSANAYDYCNADPVNCTDLDGHLPKWMRSAWKGVRKVAKVAWDESGELARKATDTKWGKRFEAACSLAWASVGTVCSLIYTAAYARQGRWKEAAITAAGAVAGKLGSMAVTRAGKAFRSRFSSQLVANGNASRTLMRNYDRAVRRISDYTSVIVGYRASYDARRALF